MTELLVGTKKGLFVLRGQRGRAVRGGGPGVPRRRGGVRDARPAHRPLLRQPSPRGSTGRGSCTRTIPPASGGRHRVRRSPKTARRAGAHLGREARRGRGPAVRRRRTRGAVHQHGRRRDLDAQRGRSGRSAWRATGSRAPAGSRCTPSALGRATRSAGRGHLGRRRWITEDAGETWRTGFSGLVPEYVPEEAREGTNALCVHNMHRAPRRPERLFMQFHGNVYRSDDRGRRGRTSTRGSRAASGSPWSIDPADPDSAFVIPLDRRRRPDHARRQRFGSSRRATRARRGRRGARVCPQAMRTSPCSGRRSDPPGQARTLELYFGATSGAVFGSADAGASWFNVHERLAPVTSVRVA